MNNKMAINTYLSTIESKNKLSKQEEQKRNHRYGEHRDGNWWGEPSGEMAEKVKGLRCTNWQVHNRQGDVKSKCRKCSC